MMTLEALSAVVLAAIFLHEGISAAQGLGGVAILVAAAVIAWSHRPNTEPTDPHEGATLPVVKAVPRDGVSAS